MKHRSILLGALALALPVFSAAPAAQKIGIVNFSSCVSESKLGKQEQSSFESLRGQLTSLVEETDKQLKDLEAKFNDQEYMDGLSPQGEEELKAKYRNLSDEMGRYQNQFYQLLNQANMRMVQVLSTNIATASEKVAQEKQLHLVLSKDACFFASPALEVTTDVVSEMDKHYEQEMKRAEVKETDAKKGG